MIDSRIEIDGDVLEIAEADACFLEAELDGLGGEACPVFDAADQERS